MAETVGTASSPGVWQLQWPHEPATTGTTDPQTRSALRPTSAGVGAQHLSRRSRDAVPLLRTLPSGNAARSHDRTCATPRPWTLPAHGLAVFHGARDTPRFSHYFLPRLLLQGKRVLILDGANCADPRLLERLARQRGVPFEQFNRQIQIARAFTCFQLTELVVRVPRLLADFPAEVLIVTAFPELYFDEDVRDWDARVAFEQALANLRRLAGQPFAEGRDFRPAVEGNPKSYIESKALSAAGLKPRPSDCSSQEVVAPLLKVGTPETPADLKVGATRWGRRGAPLAIALFSAASTFMPPPARRRFFAETCAAVAEVWKFSLSENNRLGLKCERASFRGGVMRQGMASAMPQAINPNARWPLGPGGSQPAAAKASIEEARTFRHD